MQKIILVFTLCLSIGTLIAQDSPATLQVEISRDSVLLGNDLEITFTLKNGNIDRFPTPSFKDFEVVFGPSSMISTNIINGVVSTSSSITYQLRPSEVGLFFIEPLSIEVGGEYLETEPMAINVHPNPDGIIQKKQRKNRSNFDSFFSNPFEEFRKFDSTFPDQKQKEPKKKKKKTTRL